MGFVSVHFLLSTQVPLARNVSAPADEVVLCNGNCPAHLFTILGVYGVFFLLLVVLDLVSSSNQ